MGGTFYANGKLLISGEYMVLHGATALVVPLKLGQHMKVIPAGYDEEGLIHWQSNVLGEPWFYVSVMTKHWTIEKTSDERIALNLIEILQESDKLNHLLFKPGQNFDIITDTDFNMNWGSGSSSAFIANIAHWAGLNPFELYFRTSRGSGADLAAAISPGPVLYKLLDKKPVFQLIDFKPAFKRNLWLVYLGNKQSSSQSVHDFLLNGNVKPDDVNRMDHITIEMTHAKDLQTFMKLMRDHEKTLADILGTVPIRELLFKDFAGEIKSLGAWGGDFVMAASLNNENFVKSYFQNKGMFPVLSFDELVL